MVWRLLKMKCIVVNIICFISVSMCYFDFELHHNLTETLGIEEDVKRERVNKLAMHGFGRILTWNVKKLGACLRQDNVEQLKEVVCVILQSANIIVLQEAENLDLSCLPCNTVLKDEYEWPGKGATEEFKVLVKTRHSRLFSIKRLGRCDSLENVSKKKSEFHHNENIYQTVMRELQLKAEETKYNGSILKVKEVKGNNASDMKGTLPLVGDEEHHNTGMTPSNDQSFDSYNNENPSNSYQQSQRVSEQSKQFRDLHNPNYSTRAKETIGVSDLEVRKHARFNTNNDKENTRFILKETSMTSDINEKPGRFTSSAKQYQAFQHSQNTVGHDQRTPIDSEKLSERQIERFHRNTTDASKHDTDSKEKDELKVRLYRNKEKLYNETSVATRNSDRFRAINNELNSIQKEIDDLIAETDAPSMRFHSLDNTTSEANSTTKDQKESNYSNTSSINYDGEKPEVGNFLYRLHNETVHNSRERLEPGGKDSYASSHEKNKFENSSSNISNEDFVTENKTHTTSTQNITDYTEKMQDLVDKEETEEREERAKQVREKEELNEELLEGLLSHHVSKPSQHAVNDTDESYDSGTFYDSGATYGAFYDLAKIRVKRSKHKHHSFKKHLLRRRLRKQKLVEATASKRQFQGQKRDEEVPIPKNLNYAIMTIKSDLNSGEQFILANVKLPKSKEYQRACVEKIVSEISNVNSESEQRMRVLILGDFHFDRLTGADDYGDMYKILSNLQIDGENYHAPITYHEKDPITTVYGRRFDNILTNINLKGNLKTIGPDFPIQPESVIMPLTLQRLYNNYVTALYTTDNDDSDSIYECIKAFQLAGKSELDNVVCKDSWVPSSYISDHLPLQMKVKMKVEGKSAPLEINIASWNIQGDTFRERLLDPAVKKGFLKALKKYHLAVFHEFPPHDRILDDQELGSSDIVRLKQGELTTEFGIYMSEDVKDGDTDMFVLRKKFKGDEAAVEEIAEPTTEESANTITTVGLFVPKIVIDTVKVRPCLYTVKTSQAEISTGVDFAKIMEAIGNDVKTRKCDFKVLLASLNLEQNFDLDKQVYKTYKYINMKCQMTDGDNKYKYNIPRSRDLADYIIILDQEATVKFDECTIGLPGDEQKRGVDKLSDFEELTTHYPLSIVVKKTESL